MGGRKLPRAIRCGSMNVRGCGVNGKMEEIGRMFNDRKLDVLALSETKLKGKGEVMFGEVNGRMSGVRERERAREGEWKELSSRLMWVRMNLGCEKWVFVSAYGPGSEKSEEVREQFWEEMSVCMRGFNAGENVVVLGDLNARVGDVEIDGVIGKFGVPGVNESGMRLVELCMERELLIGNTCFKKRMIHKYTWERVGNGRLIDRALMDYFIVSKHMRGRLTDVNVLRGVAGGMSDHFLVEGRMKVRGGYRKVERKNVREVVKVRELDKSVCENEFKEKIRSKWEVRKNLEWEGVEEEWKAFKDSVKVIAKEVCGMRKVGGRKRKGCEWWNESIDCHVKEKRKLFERYMQSREREDYERYRRKRNEVKRRVKEAKREANERWGSKLVEDYDRNKGMFWKEVQRGRKGDEKRVDRINGANGELLVDGEEVSERWGEYFESLLNVVDERQAIVTAIGNGRRMPVVSGCNDDLTYMEVYESVRKTKCGKAAGVDEMVVEYMKKGGREMIEWLGRLFNGCFKVGRVPEDWKRACIVPLYKGKGDRYECQNYRGISLLSVVGKVYGRILEVRVRKGTNVAIGEEQCGFRQGRGCTDQIFAVRQVCEKYMGKKKDVYMAFMDLEKAYDRVDREALWQVMRIYGVGGRLLKGVQSFYDDSKACVRSENGISEWFSVNVGLRQGCVLSPWLFNVYMDGVVREVSMRTHGKGVEMCDSVGSRWRVSQLLYADDTVLMADSAEDLQCLLSEFGSVCERRKLRVNVNKSKVLVCSSNERRMDLNLNLNGEILEEVNSFKYLGSIVSGRGGVFEDVRARVNEGAKAGGAMKSVWKVRSVSMEVKRAMYESILVPTVLYGAECWTMKAEDRRRVNVLEMSCLRSMCGVTRWDRVRNEEIRRSVGVEASLSDRVDRCVLRWFGHVERMDETRMVKKVYVSSVDGVRGRGRPGKVWMDGVNDALDKRGWTLEQARVEVHDRVCWRNLVNCV